MKLNTKQIYFDACNRYGSMQAFADSIGITNTRLYQILERERVLSKKGAVLPSVVRVLTELSQEGESIWNWILD